MSQDMVSIVLSLYNPNLKYLQLQLQSIDAQDYGCMEIVLWDDYPQSTLTESDIAQMITRVPFRYIRCDKNLGYVKAFEKLTTLARGKYIAYCDQDDIWHPNKISTCVRIMQKEHALLVTSDRREIDQDGNVLVSSIKKERPDIVYNWETGDHITDKAAFGCFALGMTLVMDTETARKAIPFPECTGHDKWLALCASAMGKVAFCNEPLVDYRRHGHNVTGMFNGVSCKKDYFQDRIQCSYEMVQEFVSRFPDCPDNAVILAFARARLKRNPFQILKYRALAPKIALFESVTACLPNFCFKMIIKILAK